MVLNDWARATGTVIVVNEEDIPVRPEVSSYAGMLGIDPLYLASEGVAVLAVDPALPRRSLITCIAWALGMPGSLVRLGRARSIGGVTYCRGLWLVASGY